MRVLFDLEFIQKKKVGSLLKQNIHVCFKRGKILKYKVSIIKMMCLMDHKFITNRIMIMFRVSCSITMFSYSGKLMLSESLCMNCN